MQLYPTIELQAGKLVSLTRGDLDQPQIWHVDPVEKAKEFVEAGAEWMQVTDFDAVTGTGSNADIVEEILRKAGIPVQVAGGMRSTEQIEHWIDRGAGRVVVGTAAVWYPDMIKAAAKHFPDQLVVAVDMQDGFVMVDGWKTQSAITPESLITAFDGVPLAGFLVTDIEADRIDGDASVAHISAVAELAKVPVIASGLVKSLDDISRLKYVRNIGGAIIGRSLFNRAIDLAEALEVARAASEPVAEFI